MERLERGDVLAEKLALDEKHCVVVVDRLGRPFGVPHPQ